MNVHHIDDLQWEQAVVVARQTCAMVFRDGGVPRDALTAFGLKAGTCDADLDWSHVVESIAVVLCQKHELQAA